MKKKYIWISAVVILLMAAIATGTLANPEKYYACVNNSSGAMKIVDEGEKCKNNEYQITWNAKGPKGDPGPAGPPGIDGADGADGVDGSPGAAGADGADGVDGADGADGVDGADGADGVDGSPGADGADGDDGSDGADGADGVGGITGYEVIYTVHSNVEMGEGSSNTFNLLAACPSGKNVLGGGWSSFDPVPGLIIITNRPIIDTTWQVKGYSDSDFSYLAHLFIYAICVDAE